MEFGDDDVTGVEGVREHSHGFLVQYDAHRAERAGIEAHLPFRSSRNSFVEPGWYLAVDQKRVAAVAEIAARPN